MTDDTEAAGLTPPSLGAQAADAPPVPFLPPATRLAAGPTASPGPSPTAPQPPPAPQLSPARQPSPALAVPQSSAPPQHPLPTSRTVPPPAEAAASRNAAPKRHRSPVTMFVVVVLLAGLAAGGLLAYRVVQGDANEATAISAAPSTEGSVASAPTRPSTVVSAAPTPAGWVSIVEQSVGFSLPTTTQRASAWLVDATGQPEGPNSASYTITPGGGVISVIWDGGDPTGREAEIVARVARVPGFEAAPAITNWTPIPSRLGTAVGADYAFEGEGLTMGSGKLLVFMTPTAVVVVKYQSTDDPAVVDAVFRSITVDGQPAF